MILGSKGHVFHACMKRHDLGTRKTRESSPNRADFECFRIARACNAEQSVVSYSLQPRICEYRSIAGRFRSVSNVALRKLRKYLS